MELRAGYKQTEVGVIPEEWEVLSVSDVTKSFQNGFAFASHGYSKSGIPIVTMAQIGLDGRFKFKEEIVNHWPSIEASKLATFQLFRGDIIIAMTDVTPEKNLIGRMTEVTEDGPLLLNQRVGLLRLDPEKIDPYFLRAVSNSKMWRDYARAVASLGVQANIGTKEIQAGKLPVPPLPEQRAIAEALSDVDKLIGALDQLIGKKRNLKQATMQQLLTGQTRLPGFSSEWEVKKIGELLKYERPDKYFVKSDDYQDNAKTPVLTANKSFVLGHTNEDFGIYEDLPAIIFDDFTTDSKFVDFRFKVKSSAIKILKTRSAETNLKFVYERMRLINFPLGEHKRHYISEFHHIEIPTPKPAEQTAIAEVLLEMDAELAALTQRRDKTRDLKQGIMQELLTGRTRLV